MESRPTNFRNLRKRHRLTVAIVPVASGLLFLTACAADPPLYDSAADAPPGTSVASSTEPNPAGATYTPQPPATTPEPTASPAAPLNFPQTSCGDQASAPSETWYSVFLDGANVDEIRSKYCGDAISTARSTTGAASVQVASFTNYEKAARLAEAIGGRVEQTATQATPNAVQPGPSPDRAAPNGQPTPTRDSQTASPLVGQSAFLAAKDPNSSINIRESASVASPIQSVASPGDQIQISNSVVGNDGYTWYEVQLNSARGWIRGDLITTESAVARAPAASEGPSVPREPARAPTPESRPFAPDPSPYSSSNQSAVLNATDPNSSINIREQAGTASLVRHIGYPGERVRVSDRTQGDDGYTWYRVEFESGAAGWVRGDFIANN
jgi:hypothetical protein